MGLEGLIQKIRIVYNFFQLRNPYRQISQLKKEIEEAAQTAESLLQQNEAQRSFIRQCIGDNTGEHTALILAYTRVFLHIDEHKIDAAEKDLDGLVLEDIQKVTVYQHRSGNVGRFYSPRNLVLSFGPEAHINLTNVWLIKRCKSKEAAGIEYSVYQALRSVNRQINSIRSRIPKEYPIILDELQIPNVIHCNKYLLVEMVSEQDPKVGLSANLYEHFAELNRRIEAGGEQSAHALSEKNRYVNRALYALAVFQVFIGEDEQREILGKEPERVDFSANLEKTIIGNLRYFGNIQTDDALLRSALSGVNEGLTNPAYAAYGDWSTANLIPGKEGVSKVDFDKFSRRTVNSEDVVNATELYTSKLTPEERKTKNYLFLVYLQILKSVRSGNYKEASEISRLAEELGSNPDLESGIRKVYRHIPEDGISRHFKNKNLIGFYRHWRWIDHILNEDLRYKPEEFEVSRQRLRHHLSEASNSLDSAIEYAQRAQHADQVLKLGYIRRFMDSLNPDAVCRTW